DDAHALAFELSSDLLLILGTRQARVVDRDALEAAPLEHRRDPPANGLDLGQLGHRATVAARGQATTSSRTGRSSGGTSAISYAASTSRAATSASSSVRACTSASGSPSSTRSPRFARSTIPTEWSTSSSFVRRPAPRCTAA